MQTSPVTRPAFLTPPKKKATQVDNKAYSILPSGEARDVVCGTNANVYLSTMGTRGYLLWPPE